MSNVGQESANYSYEIPLGQRHSARDILRRIGAVPRGKDPIHWVIRGHDHWIDLELNTPPGTIQFRIALSNPPGAIEVLRRVFEGLLSTAGGRILDLQRAKYVSRVNLRTWRSLVAAYELKKATGYAPVYGDLEAAISADDLLKVAEKDGHVRVKGRTSSIPTAPEGEGDRKTLRKG